VARGKQAGADLTWINANAANEVLRIRSATSYARLRLGEISKRVSARCIENGNDGIRHVGGRTDDNSNGYNEVAASQCRKN
jgi:hypothetical protein